MDSKFVTQQPDRTEQLLVDELKEVVGDEAVERTDLDFERARQRPPARLGPLVASSRLLLLVAGASLLVVGVIASLALDNWLLLGVALGVHALLAAVVVGSALLLSTGTEKPAATTEAALEEAGVSDPSGALDDLVEQVNSQRQGGSSGV
jgi:Flp pilus assembly protein TadB